MKKCFAVLLAMMMTVGLLTGCGTTTVSAAKLGTTVGATLNGSNIYMDEINYYVRTAQAAYEEAGYLDYYGIDSWDDEVDYYGILTFVPGDSIKSEAVAVTRQAHILAAEAEKNGVTLSDADLAKVKEAAAAFFTSKQQAVIDAVNLTEERLTEILTVNALANRMYEAMLADVDTTVTDEEARQYDVTYMYISSTTLTDKETVPEGATPESMAQLITSRVNDGEALADVAAEYGLTASSVTMGDGDASASYGKIAQELAVGACGYAESAAAGAYYIVERNTDYNDEATQSKKETMASGILENAFAEAYAEMEASYEFTPVYKVLLGIVVKDPLIEG